MELDNGNLRLNYYVNGRKGKYSPYVRFDEHIHVGKMDSRGSSESDTCMNDYWSKEVKKCIPKYYD